MQAKQSRPTLKATISQINKRFGQGTLVQLGQTTALNISTFPSGFPELDRALGGGYPRGRIIEIFGPESSGKTTLALHAIAQVQVEGGTAAFIDMEKCLCPHYAAALGVDINRLLVSRPETGEQAITIMEALVSSQAVDLVVIDSVAALLPEREVQLPVGELLEDCGISKLMSRAMRRLMAVSHPECSIMFMNQLRCRGGVFPKDMPTGGRALPCYASVRLELARTDEIRHRWKAEGIRIKAKLVKNKISVPGREASLDLMFPAPVRVADMPGVGALALHCTGVLR